jgi:hypothetical protein
VSNATLQMAEFRALVNARTVGDQALWHELGDLLHSIFDELDNLRGQITALKKESVSQADAIEARGRAIIELAQRSNQEVGSGISPS